ncbi:AMP-binding protein, partial [Rhodococcus sp. (in: high G+C Gram-positive bacteria)]|uniref:AMP-binding protein n=1 Tax=Rhodococcus sp. TaxID=1831 RepID=UPI0038911509
MTSENPTWMSTTLSYPSTSMAVWAPSMAAAYGDRPAIVDGDRVYSYRELDEQSAQFACALASTGVEPGDVVLLHLGNCAEFHVAYYGALRVGAAVSPVNPLQPESELRRRIEETGAVAVVTGQQQFDTLLRAQTDTTVGLIAVVSDEPVKGGNPATMRFSDVIAGQRTTFTPATVSPDDVAHIAYTGGTTGISKGVRVLHRNVIANVAQMCAWRAGHRLVAGPDGLVSLEAIEGLHIDGVVPGVGSTIVVSPLFHAHALINTSFLLMCGLTQVLSGRFDPARVLEQIEQYHASYITGTPAMWHALVTHP